MSHSRKIFKNSFFSILDKILKLILGFIIRKLFIDYMGQELLGLNSLYSDVLGLLNLAELGIGTALQFNLYQPIVENDRERIGSILTVARRLYNIIGISVITVGIFISFFLQYIISENPFSPQFLQVTFILNVLGIGASYFYVHKRLYLQSCEDTYVTNIIDTAIFVVATALKLIAILLFKNYYIYVVLLVAQNALSNYLINFACNKKYPGISDCHKVDPQDRKKLLRDLKDVIPVRIAYYIYSCTDNIIISSVMGLASVALLGNYQLVIVSVFSIAPIISDVMRSSFGNKIFEDTDMKKIIHYLKTYEYIQFLFSSFCSVTLYCLLDEFIGWWFGTRYLLPVVFTLVLTIDFYVHSMYQPLSMMYSATGKFKEDKVVVVSIELVNIVVSVFLALKWGLIGPALGTLLSNTITYGWRIHCIHSQYCGIRTRESVVDALKYMVITSLEGVALAWICRRISFQPTLLEMLVKTGICFVVVIGVNILLFLKTKEMDYLKEIFFKRLLVHE